MRYAAPALLSLSAAACSRAREPFAGRVTRSRFFEYHDQANEPLCPTLLALLDRHAQMIGGQLGLPLDGSDPYQYYKFLDLDAFAQSGCPPEWGACALGNAVYATTYFHPHELAHDYAFRAFGGWSVGLLNEGEAVALSCIPSYDAEPTEAPSQVLGPGDWRTLVDLYGNSLVGYLKAGFWMTYLVERFGWSRVAELHARIPPGTSSSDFEVQFAQVYPLSMDQAWSEALAAPSAPSCFRAWDCMSTPLAVGEDVPPDCDGAMHRSVAIGSEGGIVLSLGGVSATIELRTCGDSAASQVSPIYQLAGGGTARTTHWASLPPGTYTLFSDLTPTDVAFDSYFPPTLVGATCETAGTVSLDPAQFTFLDLLAGQVDGWIRLAGAGNSFGVQALNVIWPGWPSASGAPLVCDSCDPAAACTPLSLDLTSVAIGDHAALHLRGVVSAPPSSAMWGQILFVPAAAGGTGP
jgi:hypothetical protein